MRIMLCGQRWTVPKAHFSDGLLNIIKSFQSDGKHYVRHQIGERLNPNCFRKSVRGGGGSAMVWEMFSAARVGRLKRYMAQTRRVNARTFSAKHVKQFPETENIEIIKWPSPSPNLNPVEFLWKILGDKVMAKTPSTLNKLWKRPKSDQSSVTI